jgi:diaminopropionate ammonia-lyase
VVNNNKGSIVNLHFNDASMRVHVNRREAPTAGSTSGGGLSQDTIDAAHQEISSWPGYEPTPLRTLAGLAHATGMTSIWYKDEDPRFGLHSFKALGGAYAVLRLLQREVARQIGRPVSSSDIRSGAYEGITRSTTVTTATDGNHGRSVAWGASLFGCGCVVYVPRACSKNRETAIESYGAQVVRTGFGYDETVRLCRRNAEREGHLVVSDTSWEGYEEIPLLVMQGYTVLTTELLNQLPSAPTHVFIQGGVGGLAGAVCWHLRARWGAQGPRIVIVEPEHAACLYASAVAGKPTALIAEAHSIMAGLDCGEVSPIAWRILDSRAEFFVTIPDSVVAGCMRLLAFSPHGDPPVVAGEAGVAGLAALLCALHDSQARSILELTPESAVLLLGTEGDTDQLLYHQLSGFSGDEVRSRAAATPIPEC